MYPIHRKIYFVLIVMLMAQNTYALKEDNQEKIYITADSSIYNYKNGVNLFEGHVKIDQGTTHITADRVTTKSNAQHKLQEAIATGTQSPAHYSTLTKPGDAILHAEAMVIKFYPIASNVTLEQNVTLKQGENRFHGQLIIYNRNDQTIVVPATKDGRAELVYNPDEEVK